MNIQRLKARFNPASSAAILIIGFGLALRLRQLTLNLSFWLDEAMLALNIVNRTFAGLIHPLDYDQGAPLGFLWVVKAFESLLGEHEFSLRLFPFLAGCLGLVILWRLARRIINPVGVIFTLIAFASSRYVVSYSAQVKQYAVDATISVLLQFLTLNLLQKNSTRKDYFLAAGFGALAIWISHAAVFTLGGIGMVLIVVNAGKKDWVAAIKYGLVSIFWGLNFAALYLIQYRSLASNTTLTNFWADYFLPLSNSAPLWIFDHLSGMFDIPGGLSGWVPSILILVLLIAGIISLVQRGKAWVWIFLISLGLTLAASGLQKYPFGGRMGMFILPGLLICVGEGIERTRRFFRAWPKVGLVCSLGLTFFLTFTSISFAIETALQPKMTENIAPTMAYLKANVREGDVIYLYHMSIPAYRYYAPKYGLDGLKAFDGKDAKTNRQLFVDEINQMKGSQRTWLLFSHLTDPEYVKDRDAILTYASQIGDKKREFSLPGTLINLYLYILPAR